MVRVGKGRQPFKKPQYGVAFLNLKVFQFLLSLHFLALLHVGLEATEEASSKPVMSLLPSHGCCRASVTHDVGACCLNQELDFPP